MFCLLLSIFLEGQYKAHNLKLGVWKIAPNNRTNYSMIFLMLTAVMAKPVLESKPVYNTVLDTA